MTRGDAVPQPRYAWSETSRAEAVQRRHPDV
eukprot:CAMPEP_0204466048 /NCGR_PEP_ID=MMETSP0471-20130131/8815_1 /ASSEMBLY_ACC=CAM_ASM_000602 /TAXON_ID=2969 /ORGANISM="Oxyrrhis marina" /LENGTH=30 /DNA_ID= /DNA_START= /DNA_END= /DNA_ORIENTATION=